MKTQNKRAQSAVEYLMTYGWAILVIIVVGAALWKLGVFDVSKYTGSAKLSISGFTVSGSQLTAAGAFNAKVGAQETITVSNVSVVLNSQTKYSDATVSGCGALAVGWSPNAEKTIACTGFTGLTSGTTYNTQVTIVYSDSAGYSHTVSGAYNPKSE